MAFAINSFAKDRHFVKSSYSRCNLTEQALLNCIERSFESATPGYRDGVVLVRLNGAGFTTPVTRLVEGDKLEGEFGARRDGEDPRVSMRVVRKDAKQDPADTVDVVLYSSTVLAEDGDNELPADEGNFEVISINANSFGGSDEPDPLTPGTLMANHFEESGGTSTGMSDEEFVVALRESRAFWKSRAMIA